MSMMLARPVLNQLFNMAQTTSIAEPKLAMIISSEFDNSQRIHFLELDRPEWNILQEIDFAAHADSLKSNISSAEKIIAGCVVRSEDWEWRWCNTSAECWYGEIYLGLKGVLEVTTFQIIENKKRIFTLELID